MEESKVPFAIYKALRHFCLNVLSRPWDKPYTRVDLSADPTALCALLEQKFQVFDPSYHNLDFLEKVSMYLMHVVVPHKLEVYKAGMSYIDCFDLSDKEKGQFEYNLIIHDLSKFSVIEAIGYAQYDFKTKSGDKAMFEAAWNHHKHNNPHHPEYWLSVDRSGASVVALEMPRIYAAEMVADWIGAGITYGNRIEDWLPQNIHTFKFHSNTMEYLVQVFEKMSLPVIISDGRLVANFDADGLKKYRYCTIDAGEMGDFLAAVAYDSRTESWSPEIVKYRGKWIDIDQFDDIIPAYSTRNYRYNE